MTFPVTTIDERKTTLTTHEMIRNIFIYTDDPTVIKHGIDENYDIVSKTVDSLSLVKYFNVQLFIQFTYSSKSLQV